MQEQTTCDYGLNCEVKNMVKVELNKWLDADELEADVRITDGDISLNAFCGRFTGNRESEQLKLVTLMAKDAKIVDGFAPPTQNENWTGEMTARIIDRQNNLLRLENLIIEFDGYLPGYAQEDHWINFRFARLEDI